GGDPPRADPRLVRAARQEHLAAARHHDSARGHRVAIGDEPALRTRLAGHAVLPDRAERRAAEYAVPRYGTRRTHAGGYLPPHPGAHAPFALSRGRPPACILAWRNDPHLPSARARTPLLPLAVPAPPRVSSLGVMPRTCHRLGPALSKVQRTRRKTRP